MNTPDIPTLLDAMERIQAHKDKIVSSLTPSGSWSPAEPIPTHIILCQKALDHIIEVITIKTQERKS